MDLTYSRLSDTEPWTSYVKELVIEALSTQVPNQTITLTPSRQSMVQHRTLNLLRYEKLIDIFWTMTSQEREIDLYVLRIPLLKGMLGQRLLVIRKKDRERFIEITTFKHATQMTYGQGHDWPDADILEHAGFNVHRNPEYGKLMKMLDVGRFDAYPLSMIEIWEEVDKRPQLNVMVDTHILLSYNAPVFIFLNPSRTGLQHILEKGFSRILENGTFDRIFNRHYQDIIQKAELKKRIVFKMDNPYMSPETKSAMKKYASLLLIN